MKVILTTLLLCLSIIFNIKGQTPLENVQKRLNWITPKDSLTNFIEKMELIRKKQENPYLIYWEAYAIYLLSAQKFLGESKKIEESIEKGIELIEKIKNKNSEHYALLALLQGLEINYSSAVTTPFKAAADEANARKAIKLDPSNLRAYYALAMKDYYTPKMFGGGKIAEENFLKAISLDDKSDSNPYAPDWGKTDAYRYLIWFYKKNDQLDKAKKCLDEALSKYPDNKSFKAIQSKL